MNTFGTRVVFIYSMACAHVTSVCVCVLCVGNDEAACFVRRATTTVTTTSAWRSFSLSLCLPALYAMLVRECMLYSRAVKRIRFDHVFRKSFLIRLAVSSHACACACASQLYLCVVPHMWCILYALSVNYSPHYSQQQPRLIGATAATTTTTATLPSIVTTCSVQCVCLCAACVNYCWALYIYIYVYINISMFIFWRSGQPIVVAAAAAAKRTAEERLCRRVFVQTSAANLWKHPEQTTADACHCIFVVGPGVQHNLFAQHLLDILGSISDGVWRLYTLSNNLSNSVL